ncbi:hypothetical protein [Streptomyces sp. NRRL S-1022]|uniref:hypothetical protein n=1 Tax=Streptomyces sp. NRRL S-1022 TaxID=1463880 RepID=UPI0004C02641|nr:hypothetical protein [Streptomyces sp. NRRL S-1022]
MQKDHRATTGRAGAPPARADELSELAEMRSHGDTTDDEFRRAKELVPAGDGASGRSGAAPCATAH